MFELGFKMILLILCALADQTIPATLESLASKHQNLTQVVQYLEGGYLSATTDKHVIEQEVMWVAV
jgi:hypothetical protein